MKHTMTFIVLWMIATTPKLLSDDTDFPSAGNVTYVAFGKDQKLGVFLDGAQQEFPKIHDVLLNWTKDLEGKQVKITLSFYDEKTRTLLATIQDTVELKNESSEKKSTGSKSYKTKAEGEREVLDIKAIVMITVEYEKTNYSGNKFLLIRLNPARGD